MKKSNERSRKLLQIIIKKKKKFKVILCTCRAKILQLEVWDFKRELTVVRLTVRLSVNHKLKRTINRGGEIKDVEIE